MAKSDEHFMREAIRQASRCVVSGPKNPFVGAVAVQDGQIVATAYRGECKGGEHAEFGLLQRKLANVGLRKTSVYTTLEPCTTRGHLKTPCAYWLVMRQIKKVYIGMLDPNPDIRGLGFRILRLYGIDVQMFRPALQREVELQNARFTAEFDDSSPILQISHPAGLKIPGSTRLSALSGWLAKPVKGGTNRGLFKFEVRGRVRGLNDADRIYVYVYTDRRHKQGNFPINASGAFSGYVSLARQAVSFTIYFQVTGGDRTLYRAIAMVR